MSQPITAEQLAQRVQVMRQAQKDYFNGARSQSQLKKAKALESEVDGLVKRIIPEQSTTKQGSLL